MSPSECSTSAIKYFVAALGLFAFVGPLGSLVSQPAHADRYYDRDIGRFYERDHLVWRGGHWRSGWHAGRQGWWWVAGGHWYYYPQPIYPYPDPYLPPVVVIHERPPQPVIQGPPPTQFWYYCDKPAGYYPYVPTCPTPWKEVAAQNAAPQAPAPQAPAAQAPANPPPPPKR